MTDDINNSDNWVDEADLDAGIFFYELMHQAVSPIIKRFLNEYFGEKFYNLQSETYLEIEKTIREDFIFADEIPDILYRHSSITDDKELDKAFKNFKPSGTPIAWPKQEQWFDRELDQEDEDDTGDPFLDYTDPDDLNDEQLKAKEIINLIDEMTSNTQRSAHFMKSGYDIIMKESQLFLEKNAPFDLSVLSNEGFLELHMNLNLMIETLLEDLEEVIYGDLSGEKK
jgi:hypothetical protein